MANSKRRMFPVINTYQGKIIFAVFVPALFLHLCLFAMLTFLHLDLGTLVIKEAPPEVVAKFVDSWSSTVILISLFFVSTLLIITFVISRNMVGAFERVVDELDEVIEGKKQVPITARDYDSLANDLLKRINILIEAAKK